MTVVNPKSISGINSITTGSGSDNLLTIHTSDANNTERLRIDSTGTTKIVTGIVTTLTATTGIVTTLTTNTLTANSTAKVGSGVTLSPDGDVFVTGVTTSTTVKVGGGVTISESGIEASGIGITCANINGGQISGRRNLIMNGAMQIAQRATSGTSGGFDSLDRWYSNLSGGAATFSQETNANPSETGGIQKYDRLNVSTSSDYTSIRQKIEDVTSVPAGTVTLSFYAKGTAPVGGLYAWTTQDFGDSGSSDVDGTPVLITSSLTSSWVRYVVQISVGSVDGKTIGAESFFQVTIGQYSNTGGTAYDLNITGVQLEAGLQATAFEKCSYGEELALCQRYYQKYRHGSYRGINFMGRATSSNTVVGVTYGFPPMRTAASGTVNGTGSYRMYRITDGTASTPTSISFAHENYFPYNVLKFNASMSSGTFSSGNMCTMYNTGTGGVLQLDAEL